MRTKRIISIIALSLLCVFSTNVAIAEMIVESHLVSGKVTKVKEMAITIEGKGTYQPAPFIKKSHTTVGSLVTLRYFIKYDGVKYWLEEKSGLNSLAKKKRPRFKVKKEG